MHSLQLLASAALIDIIGQDLKKKMNILKDFAEAVHEVPQVRRVQRMVFWASFLRHLSLISLSLLFLWRDLSNNLRSCDASS